VFETAAGIRIVTGAEGTMIKEGISSLIDTIYAEKTLGTEISFGIGVFEDLTPDQKMTCLRHATRALLLPEIEPLPKAALHDGTVAAIYAQLNDNIEYEIQVQLDEESPENVDAFYRQLIVAALNQLEPDQQWPNPQSVSTDEWQIAIDAAKLNVLADEDWMMEQKFLDMAPEHSESIKEFLGVDPDYFTLIAPDDDSLNPERDRLDLIALVRTPEAI